MQVTIACPIPGRARRLPGSARRCTASSSSAPSPATAHDRMGSIQAFLERRSGHFGDHAPAVCRESTTTRDVPVIITHEISFRVPPRSAPPSGACQARGIGRRRRVPMSWQLSAAGLPLAVTAAVLDGNAGRRRGAAGCRGGAREFRTGSPAGPADSARRQSIPTSKLHCPASIRRRRPVLSFRLTSCQKPEAQNP